MRFDAQLLNVYRTLLQTTDLQKAYQEFVRWFRFLRSELEKQLPEYRFQGGIAENGMDYAYFQFADPAMKAAGLKLVVVFVHRAFRLEVWLSGVNRAAQRRWAEALPPAAGMERADDSGRRDYILRVPVEAEPGDDTAAVAAIRQKAEELRAYWSERAAEPNR